MGSDYVCFNRGHDCPILRRRQGQAQDGEIIDSGSHKEATRNDVQKMIQPSSFSQYFIKIFSLSILIFFAIFLMVIIRTNVEIFIIVIFFYLSNLNSSFMFSVFQLLGS